MLDEGFYVIQLSPDSEPEPARLAGEIFVLHGMEETVTPDAVYRIGDRIEIDQITLTAWNVPRASAVTQGHSPSDLRQRNGL